MMAYWIKGSKEDSKASEMRAGTVDSVLASFICNIASSDHTITNPTTITNSANKSKQQDFLLRMKGNNHVKYVSFSIEC